MKATYFKPSIHGWPFFNSFNYKLLLTPFGDIEVNMGFCGGMCWVALDRFYSGVLLPRNTPDPAQGDDLYNELLQEQVTSLDISKVIKIFDWQNGPTHEGGIFTSQGYMTLLEWDKIKEYLDNSRPVTLTLSMYWDNFNPLDLVNNHRVVAYDYEERPLTDLDVPASDHANMSCVTIFIYDPNEPNDDDVSLTFYTGGDNSEISLSHSKKGAIGGFFLDDKPRDYASSDSTSIQITSYLQTGISSATLADYNLTFSWKCRFIPYFCIQIDGKNWEYNDLVKENYLPNTDKNNKQCPAKTGSITLNLQLPRSRSKVTVRLLDTDDYTKYVWIDATPAIFCYPYIRKRFDCFSFIRQHVCDSNSTKRDLFTKDPDHTQIFHTPDRWVEILLPPANLPSEVQWAPMDLSDPTQLQVKNTTILSSYCFGNIEVPIYANFVERNLVGSETQLSGIVKIFKHGQLLDTHNLSPLTAKAQKIFDGFKDNPDDYENDTKVEFTFKAKDKFNLVVEGQVIFYGKSIIHFKQIYIRSEAIPPSREPFFFDSPPIVELESATRMLIENGLIDIALEMIEEERPPRPELRPFTPYVQPKPIFVLMRRLRSHGQLQRIINQSFKMLWHNPDNWKESWNLQSEILKQIDQPQITLVDKPIKVDDILEAMNELRKVEQREYDAVIINTFAQKTIEQLRRNPTVIKKLKEL